MNSTLMKAILSMDAYNRGYNSSIKFGSDIRDSEAINGVTKIGNATIHRSQNSQLAEDISFYAIAYDYNGEKVISFRGTDQLNADRLNGFDIGAGFPDAPQAGMAYEFYRSVASSIGAANLTTANISLTGHSLGGGIAGLLASIYHRPATIFDNMAFEDAALSVPNFITNSGVLDLYYNPLLRGKIWGAAPVTTPIISVDGSVAAYETNGELLSIPFVQQETPTIGLSIGENVDLPDWDKFEKHSMSTLVMLLYAGTSGIPQDWKKSAQYFWPVLYDDAFAGSIGVNASRIKGTDTERDFDYSSVLRQILAYSAINEGTTVFGNTGIVALYDDANDLGLALSKAGGVSALVIAAAEDISKAFVQHAGLLALNKISDENPQDGILTMSGYGSEYTLTLDLSATTWEKAAPLNGLILPHDDIVRNILLTAAVPVTSAVRTAMWGTDAYNYFDRIVFGVGAYTVQDNINAALDPAKATLLIGGAAGEMFYGSTRNDLILGGGGDDYIIGSSGRDIAFGGEGSDSISYEDYAAAISVFMNATLATPYDQYVLNSAGLSTRLIAVENVIGTKYSDSFTDGNIVANAYDGGNGNDFFFYTAGKTSFYGDTFYGGEGIDTLSLSTLTMGVSATINTVKKLSGPTSDPRDFFSSVENLTLTPLDDRFTLSGGIVGKIIIDGGAGNDTVLPGSADSTWFQKDNFFTSRENTGTISFINFESLAASNIVPDETKSQTVSRYSQIDYTASTVKGVFELFSTTGGDPLNNYVYFGTVKHYLPTAHVSSTGLTYSPTIYGTNLGDTYNVTNVYGHVVSVTTGTGNDTIIIDGVDDTIWTYTGGHDVFKGDNPSNIDTLRLGAGITSNMITWSMTNSSGVIQPEAWRIVDLKLTIQNYGSITIEKFVVDDSNYGSTYSPLKEISLSTGAYYRIYEEGLVLRSPESNFDRVKGYESNGNDIRTGSTRSDYIYGKAGNDTIFGEAGGDYLYGGLGNDKLNGGTDSDDLNGGSGSDEYHFSATDLASSGPDTITEEIIIGDMDSIVFGAGINAENVFLSLNGGLEIRFSNLAGKILVAASTIESDVGSRLEAIKFANGTTWSLTGGLKLDGDAANNTMYGTAYNDTINAYGGSNTIYAGGGDDIIYGGAGSDNLLGDAGNDTFKILRKDVYTPSAVYGGDGNDTVDIYYTAAEFTTAAKDRLTADLKDFENGSVYLSDLSLWIESTEKINVYVDNVLFDFTAAQKDFTGTASSETITGNALDNIIMALAGNDVVNGLAGNDRIEGGTGNDTLDGGTGLDILIGGADNDNYKIALNSGLDTITDQSGTDKISFGTGITAASTTYARTGNDLLISVSGSQVARIVNHFVGTGAVETLQFADATTVNLQTLIFPINGTAGSDTLAGTTGADILNGLGGNDILNGNGGNDIFDGGTGTDTLNGGSGNDNYTIAMNSGLDTITDTSGAEKVIFGAGLNRSAMTLSRDSVNKNDLNILFSGVKIAVVKSHFTGTGNIETLQFSDGATYNLLTHAFAFNGTSASETLRGHLGVDIINGGTGNDILYGGGGNDTLSGQVGNDTLRGEAGNDIYVYDGGLDKIYETGGTDTLKLAATMKVDSIVFSNIGSVDTKMTFATGSNEITLYGQRGTNANLKVETVQFADGFSANLATYKSWIWGSTAAQTTNGTANADTILGRAGNDTINGNAGNDALHGGAGNDIVRGGDGNDQVNGGIGNDTLYGDAGNDIIYGDDGLDTLLGGTGADSFVFLKETAFKNIDVISDFKKAELDKINIADLLQGYDPLTQAITDYVQITTSGANSILKVDVDGGANNFVQIATINGITGLTDEAGFMSDGYLIAL